MYTQCPDCNTAFRVTAKVLKQAAGKVRCGGCGTAFNALEFLSETMPKAAVREVETPIPELQPPPDQASTDVPASLSAKQTKALLKSLDELAGSDIRIEDTGVEWRVLDDDEVPDSVIDELLDESPTPVDELLTNTPTAVDAGELFAEPPGTSAATKVDELRFDDDTPLPDDLAGNDDSDSSPAAADPTDSSSKSRTDSDEAGANADNDDDGGNDWADILGEFEQRDATKVPPLDAELAALEDAAALIDVETQAAADIDPTNAEALSADAGDNLADIAAADSAETDIDTEPDSGDTLSQALDNEDDAEPVPLEFGAIATVIADDAEQPDTVDEHAADEESPDTSTDSSSDSSTDSSTVSSTDTSTVSSTDTSTDTSTDGDDGPGETRSDDDKSPTNRERLISDAESSPGFESIVMEGERVSSALGNDKQAADIAAAAFLAEQASTTWRADPAEPTVGRSRGMAFAVAALAVLLGAQTVHQSRETLLTVPFIGGAIGFVYKAVGQPVYPAWDVSGWRIEATTGNTDDSGDQLTVYSRIGNQSAKPLPYPLIRIVLTDRYDAVVGGRVLLPAEYLAGDLDPQQLISPGATFNAIIPLLSPGDAAAGFKLNICYGLSEARLRCADNGFR